MIKGSNLVSLKEYAKMHDADPSTIRHRIRRGSTKAVKIGRDWFIDRNEPYLDHREKHGRYKGWPRGKRSIAQETDLRL